jgi:anti-sigma B factor antagonist
LIKTELLVCSKVFSGKLQHPIFVSTQSSIQVGVANGLVHIRVEGKGSFQNSASLKDFAKEMLARGHREFVVDLAACPLMDSTFMGTLAGIALKLKGCGEKGAIHIVNLNERNQGLLCNLGLDQLLSVECTDFSGATSGLPTSFLPTTESDKLVQAKMMLEAHEAVVTANPENEAKFKDVLEFLRSDIAARQ